MKIIRVSLSDSVALTFNVEERWVKTFYDKGRWSGGGVVPEDIYHGDRLGMLPIEHRYHHELAHHVVAFYSRDVRHFVGSPIVYRDAHHFPQPKRESELEEWKVTSFQYFCRGMVNDSHFDPGAIQDLRNEGFQLDTAVRVMNWFFGLCRLRIIPSIDVSLYE